MTTNDFSDETLMAYADGALDPAEAARVGAAVAADPALARRLALFSGTRDVLARAAAARPEAPVPDALMARVRATIEAGRAGAETDATVVPLRRPSVPPRPFRPMAIAAGLALALGLAGGVLVGLSLGDGVPGGLRIATLGTRGLAEALSGLPSGARAAVADGEVAIIASFRNADGELCREFELDAAERATVVSVACREAAGWQTRFAVVAGAVDTGYAPASSLETLDSYLAAIGAGAPLAPLDEAAALSAAGE
ncbi:hypothetical protein [Rhodovulum euryhalinum]|uniref:Anti-sigma factor RsiW n=1 Tax=Rhodovulum euryhalinum TaxID=35805 RepID=A0A4R2KL63_9RHOB|nr:hypothetical protein [Rhodovulum euryhalinum]TCO73322.1 hypothetical protein EV655_10286 [Rhodovulum euryhalinum]